MSISYRRVRFLSKRAASRCQRPRSPAIVGVDTRNAALICNKNAAFIVCPFNGILYRISKRKKCSSAAQRLLNNVSCVLVCRILLVTTRKFFLRRLDGCFSQDVYFHSWFGFCVTKRHSLLTKPAKANESVPREMWSLTRRWRAGVTEKGNTEIKWIL